MRITCVELDNIKSYCHATIPLRPGTTAIRGHNGAGKSTLVEAIGFALFDSLNYDQSQFVREGEKAGTVTVTFVSALDDREYQAVRRCGSNAAWYIFDPELQARPAEQKVDVGDFIRRHLRIETEIALKDLFNDALGVPQGTFTADFLLTPAQRKKKFDALLQVEDYRKAAEKLNDTRNYLLDERRQAEKRIDDLERETGQLDAWRTQLEDIRNAERNLATRLAAIQREAEQVESRRDELLRVQAELTRLATEEQLSTAAAQAAAGRVREVAIQVDESREAVRVREETRSDHAAHEAAQTRLSEVRQRIAQRDDLRQRQAAAAQDLTRAETNLSHVRERLAAALAAERRLAELAPSLARQLELERTRESIQRNVQRIAELQRARQKAERGRERLEREIADAEQRIAELEDLRPLAEELEERRERVAELQSRRAQGTEQKKRMQQVRDDLTKVTSSRERAAQQEARARENVRKILDNQATAEQVPILEAEHARIDDELRRIEARLDHNRQSRGQASGGACPFLREPCLNIQRRGTNSLATYFDGLIAQDEAALVPLRAERDALLPALEHARKVKLYFDQLDHYQQQHQQTQDQLAELDDRLTALRHEQDTIEQWLASACPDERAVAEAQTAFKASDDADKRLREIVPLQATVKHARAQHAEIAAETATVDDELATLSGAGVALRDVEAELAALGDPRHEVAGLQGQARERAPLEARTAALAAEVETASARLAQVEEALKPFALVDAEQRAIEDELERTRAGHTRHLRFEHAAALLREREDALAVAQAEARTAEMSRTRIANAHAKMRATFDDVELERATAASAALGVERGTVTERLRTAQRESEALTADIARGESLLEDLRAARDERETLVDLEKMLQQFRDTIKEAGPNIMKALLRQISTEANRIFGEILGDRSAQLAWENDYEVVLRRDGKDRAFAQLSGGEQMSAALAVRLALLRGLTRLDIAFFDEPTQNMDGERRGNLADQIRRVRGFDQLIVISHDDTFEQGLDNVVHLEKRGGETMYIEEGALVSV